MTMAILGSRFSAPCSLTGIVAALTLFVLSKATLAVSARSPHPFLILENAAVVDVVEGKVIGPRTILVADGLISAINESEAIGVPSGAIRVDCSGKYLIPGLVDMHVHLFNN